MFIKMAARTTPTSFTGPLSGSWVKQSLLQTRYQRRTLLFVDPQRHAYPLRQTAGGYDTYAIPSPDGHRLAFLERTRANNAWMIENF
jgi:hypothetical protein